MNIKRAAAKMLGRVTGRAGRETQQNGNDFYLYEYASYEDYAAVQIRTNRAKINHVWADAATLDVVAERVAREFPSGVTFGLCHGARNGFEQAHLSERLSCSVVGTDISPTATEFPNSVVWDFHNRNDEWVGACDFIYSNSIDQSWKPRAALSSWLDQLKVGGLIMLEHTRFHTAEHASAKDPFGISPHYFPYILAEWFGHQISTEIIRTQKGESTTWKHVIGTDVWLLVVKRIR